MKNTLVVFEWYATGTYTLPTFFRKRIWYYTSFKNLGWLWFRIFKTLCTILMCAKQTMKKNSSKLERTYKYILGHEVCTRHYYCYYCYYYGVDLLAREECVWKRESVCVGGERERERHTECYHIQLRISSHPVIPVLFLPYWSFQLYISLWTSHSALI